MSLLNTRILPFEATAFHNNDFVPLTENDLLGSWSVLFFYPADFTFVCPTELEDLADHQDQFEKIQTKIFACSTDTHFSHKAWFDSSPSLSSIRYPLIGDPSLQLTKNFNALREKEGLAERATFVIDPDGVIQIIEYHAEGVGRSAKELLRKVRAAQFVRENPNAVCPAKWDEGQEVLNPSVDLVGKI